MALPPLADFDQFQDWLALTSLDPVKERRAEAVLSRVSSLVRSEAGRTWEGEEVPEEIVTVTLDVARRVFENPQNNTSLQTGSYRDQRSAEFVGLHLNERERAIVGRYRTQPRGLWTQSVTRGDAAADTVYVPVEGAPPFPWYADDVVTD